MSSFLKVFVICYFIVTAFGLYMIKSGQYNEQDVYESYHKGFADGYQKANLELIKKFKE